LNLPRLSRMALLVIPLAGAAAPMALPRVANAVVVISPGTFADIASPDCSDTGVPGLGNGTATCSLRGAIARANLFGTPQVVQLSVGTYTLTIPPSGGDDNSSGDLEVGAGMNIKGAGAGQTIITAAGAAAPWTDRILEVDNSGPAPVVTISDLTITGGNTQQAEGDGGGILNDNGNLALHNVVVDKNTAASSSGPNFNGGGIASENASVLTMTNSTISNNEAFANGGGLFLSGTTAGANAFSNLFVTGNTADQGTLIDAGGGGIYDELGGGAGSVAFTDLMVTGNHAINMAGGGVYDDNNLTSGATYSRMTLAQNTAKNFGGGMYVNASFPTTKVTVNNATISGNSVAGGGGPSGSGSGGGIGMIIAGTAHLFLNNATINGNTGTQPGAGVALMTSSDTATFHNTLVVQNTNTTAGATSNCKAPNSGTPLVSTGYNLADDTTCALTGTGDRQGSTFNPQLGALKDNGGPQDGAPGAFSATLTEALPKGSIAIDTADPQAANNPTVDERGVTRPQGSASDIGAYEFVAPFVAPVLPAAGHPAIGGSSPTLLVLLILVLGTAIAAAGLGVRARS
jgi:hypothetical protein